MSIRLQLRRRIKSFLVLFFKKELLLSLLCLAAAPLPPAARPYSRLDLPWWKARFEAKQAELHRMGRVDLLWLGDSITQDFEYGGPEDWRNFQPVWDRFYGGRNAINLGFKGDATAHLLWRIENGETDDIHPRLAIVLIGANNFGHLHWPAEQTLVGIETIVAALHQRLPKTKILLLGVLPSIRSAWVDDNTALLNRDLAARYGGGADPLVIYKDLSTLFLKAGRVDPDRFLDAHLAPRDPPLHPSAQTQARMAEAIEPVVCRVLGDRNRVASQDNIINSTR
jgi:lysophospholipase L1-like esterase